MRFHRIWTRRAGRSLALLALAGGLIAASGCGDDNSTAAGSGEVDSAGVARAEALVKKASTRPTSVGLAEPVGKEIPTGKRVVYISCGAEACATQADIIKQGAADLGWTATTIGTDGSPEQLQNAFETALRQGADAVILNAVDRATVSKQIKEAQQKGVPFVTCCSVEEIGDGILYNTSTPDQNTKLGENLAAFVVADSGGEASTLYVNISAFQILKSLGTSYESSQKELCPSCGYGSIDIPLTSLGKDAPDRIVSYLRSHPDVNYVVLSVSNALGAGLPAALQAAGLGDRVKIVGQSADTLTFQDLQAGKVEAVVPFDYYAVDYLMLDALARQFVGAPIPETPPPLWITTSENLPSTEVFPIVENYREEFKKLWGKS